MEPKPLHTDSDRDVADLLKERQLADRELTAEERQRATLIAIGWNGTAEELETLNQYYRDHPNRH